MPDGHGDAVGGGCRRSGPCTASSACSDSLISTGMSRSAPPPTDVDESAARLLKLLAEPTRRRIFGALMAGETCNCELVESLGLAENLVSHHIKQLRLAGFVRERRDLADARWVHYGLDGAALAAAWASLSAFLDPAGAGSREPICPRPPQSSPAGAGRCERGACRRTPADHGADDEGSGR